MVALLIIVTVSLLIHVYEDIQEELKYEDSYYVKIAYTICSFFVSILFFIALLVSLYEYAFRLFKDISSYLREKFKYKRKRRD